MGGYIHQYYNEGPLYNSKLSQEELEKKRMEMMEDAKWVLYGVCLTL